MENCKINHFCYMCGHFIPSTAPGRNLTNKFNDIYLYYFGQTVIENKNWVLNHVCTPCYNGLLAWSERKRKQMPFGVPMMRMRIDPGPHSVANCYGCVNFKTGLNRKNVSFQSCLNAQTPLPHTDEIPVPKFPSPDIFSASQATDFSATSADDPLYEPGPPDEPILHSTPRKSIRNSQLESSKGKRFA